MCAFLRAEKQRLGCGWRDLAVLCRYRSQQFLVALALDAGDVPRTRARLHPLHAPGGHPPAHIPGPGPRDELPGAALAGLLNRPNRYTGTAVVESVGAAARPWERLQAVAAEEPAAGPRPLTTLVDLVRRLVRRPLGAGVRSPPRTSSGRSSRPSGSTSLPREADAAAADDGAGSDGAGPLEVFDALLLLAETYPEPAEYLRMWDRLRADEEAHAGVADDTLSREESEEDRVVIGTIHAAKGGEYDSVVIPDYDCDVSRWSAAEVEEERRVVYVGVTRARDAALFTVDTTLLFAHPFLRKLVETPDPDEHAALSAWLDEESDADLRRRIAARVTEIEVLFPELRRPGADGLMAMAQLVTAVVGAMIMRAFAIWRHAHAMQQADRPLACHAAHD